MIEIFKFEGTQESTLSIFYKPQGAWDHENNTSGKMRPEYKQVVRKNLLERITHAQQHLEMLSEEKEKTTALDGKGDPCLLELIATDERHALSVLQSFLDDLFVIDPESSSHIDISR